MENETFYYECDCHSHEHMIKFDLYVWDKGEPTEHVEMGCIYFLNQYRGFFKRLWIAIKYLFNYKCRYGHFDCWDLKIEDAHKFKKMVEKYIELDEKIRSKTTE